MNAVYIIMIGESFFMVHCYKNSFEKIINDLDNLIYIKQVYFSHISVEKFIHNNEVLIYKCIKNY